MAFGISAGTYLMAGTALAGGLMSSSAAGDAADAQSAAAAQSDATQRYQYDTTRADNAPFRDTGVQANNRLAYLMGLSPNSGAGGGQSRDQIRAQLAPGFTSAGTPFIAGEPGTWGSMPNQHDSVMGYSGGTPDIAATPGRVDEVGLNTAIERQLAQQAAQQAAQSTDSSFGSLTRKFGASDLAGDVVYQSGLQFGLNEGTKGINRQAAAGGSMLSGATLKALTRFGNDYGSQKANESYNRFNNDNTTQYNRLAGLSGAGQQATNAVSAAGTNMANNISQSQQGLGNARGSAYLTQGNAWSNALNGGVSAFNNSNNSPSPVTFDGTGAWRA